MLLTSGSVFLLTCVLTDFLTPSIPPALLLLTSVSLIARITQITLFYCKVSLCVLHNCMFCRQLPPQPHRHPVFDLSQGLQSHCTFSTFKIQHYYMFLTLLNKGLTDPSKDNQHHHKIGRWKKQLLELSFLPRLLYSMTHDHTQLLDY